MGALALRAQPRSVYLARNALQLLVVPAFVSTDKVLGCEAANEVRDRLDDDADIKKLWILPKDHIDATLKASGFAPCAPIAPTEAKQLAQNLRGDAYLDGTATKTATASGSKFVSCWPATCRPRSRCHPPRRAKAGAAAKQISKDVQAAMKQLPGETKCFNSARDGKYADALVAGRAAIALYPPSTLAPPVHRQHVRGDEGAARLE